MPTRPSLFEPFSGRFFSLCPMGSAFEPGGVAPTNTAAPVASGTVRVGESLSCTPGTWTGTPTPTYAYQWRRDGVDIGGATASTHTVVSADMSAELDCVVTASNGVSPDADEPSNALASPWQPILAAKSGVLIWDGQDPQCYGGAVVGAPVAAIYTVDGVLIGTQGTTARQPTRRATDLLFDGVDDWIDTAIFNGGGVSGQTMIYGLSDVDAPTLPNSTNIRHVMSVSQSSLQYNTITYINHPAISYSKALYRDTAETNLTLAGLGPSPDFVLRDSGPGTTARTDNLDGALTALASATRPAYTPAYTYGAIGVRRLGVATLALYYLGSIRHLALDDSSYWSDTDVLLYRTCAIAAGVM